MNSRIAALLIFCLSLFMTSCAHAPVPNSETTAVGKSFTGKNVLPASGDPEDLVFYDTPASKNGWTIVDTAVKTVPVLGLANCKAGSSDDTEFGLYASANAKTPTYFITCSNFSDWVFTEAKEDAADPQNRAAIVIGKAGKFDEVVLAPDISDYKNDFTNSTAARFPALNGWSSRRRAWISTAVLTPVKAIPSAHKAGYIRPLFASRLSNPLKIKVGRVVMVRKHVWLHIDLSYIDGDHVVIHRQAWLPYLDAEGQPTLTGGLD